MKKIIKNPREYYWEELKDDYLEIQFSTDYRNRNPFQLEIVTNIIQNKWVQKYTCYIPRKNNANTKRIRSNRKSKIFFKEY